MRTHVAFTNNTRQGENPGLLTSCCIASGGRQESRNNFASPEAGGGIVAGLVGMADDPVEQRLVALLDAHVYVCAGRAQTRNASWCCGIALGQTPESEFAGFVYLAVICHLVVCRFLLSVVRLRCGSLCLHCLRCKPCCFFLLLLVSLPELHQNIERTSSHDSQCDASGSTRCRAVPRSRTTDL